MIDIGTWEWRDGIITWSPAVYRIYGRPHTPQAPQFEAHRELLTPDSFARFRDAIARISRDGVPYEIDLEVVRPDGERRWVSHRVEAIRSAQGSVVGLRSAVIDITDRQQHIEMLRSAREFSDALLESIEDGVVACDLQGHLTRFNRAAMTMFGPPETGIGPEQWPQRYGLYHADGQTLFALDEVPLYRATLGEYLSNIKMKIMPPGMPPRMVLVTGRPLLNADGSLRGGVIGVHDITDRECAEALLRQRAEEMDDLYENAPCGYVCMDAAANIERVNATALDWLGQRRDALVGRRNFADLLAPGDAATFAQGLQRLAVQGRVSDLELNLITGDGHAMPVRFDASGVRGDRGQLQKIRATLFDLTERRATMKKLEEYNAQILALSQTDPLTGAANRRRLDEALQAEIARVHRYGGGLTVVMADLDEFKKINDQHGHQAGDRALIHFVEVARSQIRDTDMLARLAGDEFIVLMPGIDVDGATECAERIRVLLGRVTDESRGPAATASFGIAGLLPGDNVDALLMRADQALYRSKSMGRNQVQLAASVPRDGEAAAPVT